MFEQKLSQKNLQKLSPQQIQLINLLQVPAANLEQRIKEELEANPALDEGDSEVDELSDLSGEEDRDTLESEQEKTEDVEMDEFIEEYIDDDPSSYQYQTNHQSEEDQSNHSSVSTPNSFHEYLVQQLGMLQFDSEREESIAEQLVGSIDNEGYLRREPKAIVNDLIFSNHINTSEEEVIRILERIQELEPPGVGARDLRECLLLQLKRKLKNQKTEPDQEDSRLLALKVLKDYFKEFAKKHYSKLLRYLEVNEEELKEAIAEILKLNPKPASSYSEGGPEPGHYVIPDFIIENKDGELHLRLNNRNAPDLRINNQYRNMLEDFQKKREINKVNKKEKDAVFFIKQKIDSAKWFIDAIKQRQNTMYHTMYAIMQYQYEYFLTGDSTKLKPMILKDISELTGYDISTVSRVANSKYVQTEFGSKNLKSFFSESVQNIAGEDVSTLEVKRILMQIVEKEDKKKPLSDEKLKKHLESKGYSIARRTVAKYREQLNIPVARLRKEL